MGAAALCIWRRMDDSGLKWLCIEKQIPLLMLIQMQTTLQMLEKIGESTPTCIEKQAEMKQLL